MPADTQCDSCEPPAVYMVSVDGAYAPSVEHPTLESAMREAERLAGLGIERQIRVLRVERLYVPKRRIDWAWQRPDAKLDLPL